LHRLHRPWESSAKWEGFRCSDLQVGRELPADSGRSARASLSVHRNPPHLFSRRFPTSDSNHKANTLTHRGSPSPQQRLQLQPQRQPTPQQVGNDGLRDKAFSMRNNPYLSLVVSVGVG
jgi:hypothetical protein